MTCGLGLVLALFWLPSSSLAHRLDEYLQATIVTIEPKVVRLQINLTPGVAVAQQVLKVIDRNHDGTISKHEAATYGEILKHDLVVRVDQREVALKLSASNFPELSELRTGLGIIQLEFSANVGLLAAGAHTLSFDNRHMPTLSVYLFNAAQPKSTLVQISTQKRNETQSLGEIEFVIVRAANE